mmetsp:Transcript_23968/g.36747  ORF Transcript_23968/g.36747 Transcript_23968/m.36747 type:complete len:154 (-) Transcript_23968:2847-3308(-)
MITFSNMYQEQFQEYLRKAVYFNQLPEHDEERVQMGQEIFELIKPFVLTFSPLMIKLIPQRTLDGYNIEYEKDGIKIRDFHEKIMDGSDQTSYEEDSEGGSANSGSSESSSSGSEAEESVESESEETNQTAKPEQPLEIPASALTGKNKSLFS